MKACVVLLLTGEHLISCLCNICSFAGISACVLKMHMGIHAVCATFTCNECDFNVGTAVALRHHMTTHGSSVPYNCAVCWFWCSGVHDPRHHRGVHTYIGLWIKVCQV